ncbi:unnamed protein product [Jaminaea pallidilutea]
MAKPQRRPNGRAEVEDTTNAEVDQPPPFVRVRLINIDHVCIPPGPHDRTDCAFLPPGDLLRKVPVLRVFGATPSGQRVCLHIHGAFPYCYVPYEGQLDPSHVLYYISKLGSELNAAITASLRGDPYAPESNHHLAAIHLVKGVPFYGFHVGWKYFLKISFVDPSHNYRIATILQSGRVMRTVFQPHEIHIRYQLQFMLDYNLFGCGYIDLETADFRLPLPAPRDDDDDLDFTSRWDENTVPPHLIQDHQTNRTSYCELEMDVAAKHVLNRRALRARSIHHDFDEADNLGVNEKLVPSLTGLWEEESKRRQKEGLSKTPPAPDSSKDVREYEQGESPQWMAEPRYRQLLEARLALEAKQGGRKPPQAFTKTHPLDAHISTTFDSVELFHFSREDLATTESELESQTAATQLPSTLYDLEQIGSQSSSSAAAAAASQEDKLDPTFFGTQAFQQDIAELERQHAAENDSGEESDLEQPQVDVEPTPDGEQQQPRTPSKTKSADVPRTPTSNTPRNVAVPRTPAGPRSILRTQPRSSVREQDSHARFLTPPRSSSSVGSKQDVSEGSLPSSSTPARVLPLSPPSAPQSPIGPTSSQMGPSFASAEWFMDHVRAQAKWREMAHSQPSASSTTSATEKPASGRRPSASEQSSGSAHSSVPAMTQLVQSGGSRSEVVQSSLSSDLSGESSIVRPEGPPGHYGYIIPAPSKIEVTASMELFNVAPIEYQDPYYSNAADVPVHAREYAGRSWRFASKTIKYLPDYPALVFEDDSITSRTGQQRRSLVAVSGRPVSSPTPLWQYAKAPPSATEISHWLSQERRKKKKVAKIRARNAAASSKPTQASGSGGSFGFKISQRQPGKTAVLREKQHMTILAIEVHVNSRGLLLPDPKHDPISAIVYSFQNEDETLDDTGSRPGLRTGCILVNESDTPLRPDRLGLSHLPIAVVDGELDLFNTLVDIVRRLDPEILVGFEIHNGSWGFVIDRARHELGYDLVPELSRVNNRSTGSAGGKNDSWGWTQTSALKITGRHILNIWRLMRGELNLNQYTYENIVFHLLRSRVPQFPPAKLTQWYKSGRPHHMSRVLRYWIERAETDLLIIETSELVFRTAEFARIYGVDFFSVISRGSQFKVESVMFRIAKPESYLLPSPNTKQVAEQNAAECLPLIMEPQSAFYKGPLLVLDFQSLYPSVMIAYNICYSTCLGRVAKFQGTEKLGITELALPRGLLSLLHDDINISANGLMYVKPHVRRSLLAKMLGEILDTRVMVKGSMKGKKSDKAFMRLQNARQLSLKLLANVTYGYTSATFSGRMPCVEIADSIVQYGRETLEKAVELIHANTRWGAQVVYGDTDSLFIYLPDRSKDDAFRIGNEIADAVTAQNPKPIKLKFEKVYLPSVLLAKKRYVGFKYESPEETVPDFNAKGIETVRRDGFPALQKMLEACIRILFTSQDLSLVKSYCQKQWRSILAGTASVQQFIIAKEVRLGGYSENGVPPPGAAVSTRKMLSDPRSEPQHAERVPYLITQGEPKAKLNDLAVTPDVMLAHPQLQLNALYYINRGIIPPLTRVFNLLGADVEAWFKEMPRPTSQDMVVIGGGHSGHGHGPGTPTSHHRLTLTDHYRRNSCLACGRTTEKDLCQDCLRFSPSSALYTVLAAHAATTRTCTALERICNHCSRLTAVEVSPCVSLDCPVQYERETARRAERAARDRLAKVEVMIEAGEEQQQQQKTE